VIHAVEVAAMVAIVIANAPALPIRDVNMFAVVLAAFPRLAAVMCPVFTRITAMIAPVIPRVTSMVTPVFTGITAVFTPIFRPLMPLRFALVPDVPFLITDTFMPLHSFVPRAGAMALHIMTPRAMPFRVTSITMALSALHMTARTLRVASATA
jgi:hypothetical protein